MSTTVAEVIARTREEVLDDTDSQKYLWSNDELIHHLNRAANEIYKVARPAVDQRTTDLMEVSLLSNLGVYALDSRVLSISDARLDDNALYGSLDIVTEASMNATSANWRATTGTPSSIIPGYESGYLCVYPKFDDTCEYVGDSDITFIAGTKTISQTDGDFSDLAEGDEVVVTGTTNNNTTFTVVTVGTTSFTVSETVTGESNTSATIRKVRDTLIMTVTRLMATRYVTADIAAATVITDLRDDWCDGLPDGIAKRAFLKPDSYTYYPQKAAYHKNEFKEFLGEVKRDVILLHRPDHTRRPRRGTTIGY